MNQNNVKDNNNLAITALNHCADIILSIAACDTRLSITRGT